MDEDEIPSTLEVTRAMIEAGRFEYAQYASDLCGDQGWDYPVEEMLRSVFLSMLREHHKGIAPEHSSESGDF